MFCRHNRLGIAWALLILLLFGLPGSTLKEAPNFVGLDKLIHAGLFAVLILLLCVGFLKQENYPRLQKWAIQSAFFFSLIYGALLEVLQGTVFVGRTGKLDDVLANTVGTLLGLLSFYLIYGRRHPYFHHRK